jgi:Family of unknown function (DUF6476)
MRGLKILVVVMGVMLIIGFAVLVGAVAGRMSRSGSSPAATARAFNGSAIDIPRGVRIEAMTAGTDHLVLALALPEGGRQLLIIDLTTGARLGTIELRATP